MLRGSLAYYSTSDELEVSNYSSECPISWDHVTDTDFT